MNRRELLSTASGLAVLGAVPALAQNKDAKAPPPASAPVLTAPTNKALIEAAEACARAGRDCLEMCVRTLASGDTMMAECSLTVRQMLPLCEAVADLARVNSAHLKAVAAICAKACRECEKVCQKHASHHAECKACQDSCHACAAECDKLA